MLKGKEAGEKMVETSGRAAEDASARASALILNLAKNRPHLLSEFDTKLLTPFLELVIAHLPEPSTFGALQELVERLGSPESAAESIRKMPETMPDLLKKDTIFAEYVKRKSEKSKVEPRETSRRCLRASVYAVIGDSALDRGRAIDAFIEDNMGEHFRFQESLRNNKSKRTRRGASEVPRKTIAMLPVEVLQDPKFKTNSQVVPRRSLAPKGLPPPKIKPKKRPIDGEGIVNLHKVTREEAEKYFGSPAGRKSSNRQVDASEADRRRPEPIESYLDRLEASCDRIDVHNLIIGGRGDSNDSFN